MENVIILNILLLYLKKNFKSNDKKNLKNIKQRAHQYASDNI